jgi:ABC-type amino acid transport substrate-binding protein
MIGFVPWAHASGRLVVAAAVLAACGPGVRTSPLPDTSPAAAAERDAGDSWTFAHGNGRGMITVLYVPAEGFAYREADGHLTGVTVELVRDFVAWAREEHGVELGLRLAEEPDWSTFYARVREGTGGVFGLGNVTITEERRRELQFTPPYMTNVAVLVTHHDVPDLGAVDDVRERFAGLAALAFRGTLHERRLRALRDAHLPAAPLEFAGSNAEILARVAEGGRFAYVDGYNYWRAVAAGAPLRRHAVADDPGETFGIILPPGSDWVAPWTEFFAAEGGYTASPRYREILVQHLGEALAETILGAAEAPSAGGRP